MPPRGISVSSFTSARARRARGPNQGCGEVAAAEDVQASAVRRGGGAQAGGQLGKRDPSLGDRPAHEGVQALLVEIVRGDAKAPGDLDAASAQASSPCRLRAW